MIFDVKNFVVSRHFSGKIKITFTEVSFTSSRFVGTYWLTSNFAPVILDELSNALIAIFSLNTFLAVFVLFADQVEGVNWST